jgi:lipoprotein NlpD
VSLRARLAMPGTSRWLAVAALLAACHPRYSGFPEELVERSPARGGVLHTVEKGQTLWRIARTYGLTLQQLAEVNDLPDPTLLRVGMRVWVPGARELRRVEPVPPRAPVASSAAPSKEPVAKEPVAKEPVAKGPVVKGPVVKEPATSKATARPAMPRDPRGPAPVATAARHEPEQAGETEEGEPKVSLDPHLQWPVKGVLTSRFGLRDGAIHDGIDVAAPRGTPIVAADDAEVLWVGVQRGYGNLVILKHFDGLVTLYAHNDVQVVKAGDRVRRGQEIARVGETGRATGPHVHFEVRRERMPRNPLFFLPPL